MAQPLILAAASLCLIMAAAWAFQRRVANAGWIDVFWTFGTGAAGAALALYAAAWPPRGLLTAGLATLWAIRLGLHMALRVARSPEDKRYTDLRQQWGARFQLNLFGFLMLQAAVSLPLAACVLLAASEPTPSLRLADGLGAAILLIAILGEGLADRQLDSFKADPAHGPINDRGLWAWSRHPNYFFEWLGWLAYPVMAVHLSGDRPWGWAALAAPAIMFAVLRFGTGVPALEAHMLASRGQLFRDYQARTSVFFPWPPRGRSSAERASA